VAARLWGMVKGGGMYAIPGYALGWMYYRWRKGRIQRTHERRTEKLVEAYNSKKDEIKRAYTAELEVRRKRQRC
jgi:hypothetical protein